MFLLYAVLVAYLSLSLSDQGFYEDTSAIEDGQNNLVMRQPVMNLAITTSNMLMAGTSNIISALFVGQFSSSGPFDIGNFTVGSTTNLNVQLERDIGLLERIILTNNGTDGWLPLYIQCTLDSKSYEMNIPQLWLSRPLVGNKEPNTHLYDEILTSSTITYEVANSVQIYP